MSLVSQHSFSQSSLPFGLSRKHFPCDNCKMTAVVSHSITQTGSPSTTATGGFFAVVVSLCLWHCSAVIGVCTFNHHTHTQQPPPQQSFIRHESKSSSSFRRSWQRSWRRRLIRLLRRLQLYDGSRGLDTGKVSTHVVQMQGDSRSQLSPRRSASCGGTLRTKLSTINECVTYVLLACR